MSGPIEGLSEAHVAMLRASAICDDVTRERGYRTMNDPKELLALGFSKAQARVPGLLIPIRPPNGEIVTYRYRPDKARLTVKGLRPVKYESIPKSPNRLDVPFRARASLGNPKVPLWFVEGEKKSDAGVSAGLCCVSLFGVYGWKTKNAHGGSEVLGDFEQVPLKGRTCYVAFDSDTWEKKEVRTALDRFCGFLKSKGAKVIEVRIPSLGEGKTGLDDYLAAGGTVQDLIAGASVSVPEKGEKQDGCGRLLELIESAGVELWHDDDKEPYATFVENGVSHHAHVKSGRFQDYCGFLFYKNDGRGLSEQVLGQACMALSAKAKYEGSRFETSQRIAWRDGKCYLFLADDGNGVVEITAEGWRVVTSSDCEIRFLRPTSMRALPSPVRGGNLSDMQRFVNVSNEDWPLVEAFLVICFLGKGTFAVFVASGEQGSGKSFGCKMIRRLVDPVKSEVRKGVKDAQSLIAALASGFMLAIDNVSGLADWLSDSLCSIAAGAGFEDRKLYSNLEEVSIMARRPIMLNGITDVATRPDLLDRALSVQFRRLDGRGSPEEELEPAFEELRPQLLGAVLDRVVHALANYRNVKLPGDHRLQDAARFALASVSESDRPVLWRALAGNRSELHGAAVDNDPFAQAVMSLVESKGSLELPAGDLLAQLGDPVPGDWPKSARGVSAKLKRLAPVFRGVGFEVEQLPRTNHTRPWRLSKAGAEPSRPSQPSLLTESEPTGAALDRDDWGDDLEDDGFAPSPESVDALNPIRPSGDGRDGRDGSGADDGEDPPKERRTNCISV